jgi:hypothetical protein
MYLILEIFANKEIIATKYRQKYVCNNTKKNHRVGKKKKTWVFANPAIRAH